MPLRDGTPLPSRPFESPMTLAIRNSRATVTPDPAFVAAGADISEADPAQRVASDPSVIDAERDPLYGDRVERNLPIVNYGADPHKTWTKSVAAAGARQTEKERVRLGRLSRWQEQR
jgi:hypothetical protein